MSAGSQDVMMLLRSKQQALSSQIKTVHSALRKKRKRYNSLGLTEAEMDTAFRLYVMGNYSHATVVLYMQQQLATRQQDATDVYSADELSVFLEWAFLELPEHVASEIVHPTKAVSHKRFRRAQTFHNERRLRDWVITQNCTKGLAPLSVSCAALWDSLGDADLDPLAVPSRADLTQSRNRKWMQRFRARWQLRLGKIPSREFLSTNDIHDKVFLLWKPKKHDLGLFLGPPG